MEAISTLDIKARLSRDNPWWTDTTFQTLEGALPRRAYFKPFIDIALNRDLKRAVVLLGPRRVGKTVMIKQVIEHAYHSGWDPSRILYASIDTPVFSGMSLANFLKYIPGDQPPELVVFDEIQYLKDWETHLKDLVDSFPTTKFLATGSAAAALSLKSRESGAGRFSDFMLPPLTFHEFLVFVGRNDDLINDLDDGSYHTDDIESLNNLFVEYLNYGGFPEAVFSEVVRQDPDQFVRSDIIDKILLKDLPNLYGINDIQELNRLFSVLAYNAGNEVSPETISQRSGASKPTIKRYIEYLESAFLIIKIGNVDQHCRSLKRERNFKVYLNNPSMRAALFAPANIDEDTLIGHLAECAVFSQWQHDEGRNIRYARWKDGEVDIVYLSPGSQKPDWAIEVKWSDKPFSDNSRLKGLVSFCCANGLARAQCTTKTKYGQKDVGGISINFTPTSLYAYTVGRNLTRNIGFIRSMREGEVIESELPELEEG